jgi:hypothetical protein
MDVCLMVHKTRKITLISNSLYEKGVRHSRVILGQWIKR